MSTLRAVRRDRAPLPPTSISDFRALVAQLEDAADVRLSSKTVRRRAEYNLFTENEISFSIGDTAGDVA